MTQPTSTPPTLGEALRSARARLATNPDASPQREAELLLTAVTGQGRLQCYARPEQPLSAAQFGQLEALLARREQGEPIAHLLGRWEFRGLDLQVTAATLIPRPETELLVECTLVALPADRPLVCADLGTGTGAVAAALAVERPHWTLIAGERFPATIGIAAANARRLQLASLLPPNLLLVQADWLGPFADAALDAIVSNPPYIRDGDPHLSRGDLRFEPGAALAAGTDGLGALRAIIRQAPRCLRPGGWLALEHGWDQAPSIRHLLARAGFSDIHSHRDLAGHARVTSGQSSA